MQSSRLKNIIILILALVNVFLLASLLSRFNARLASREQSASQLAELFCHHWAGARWESRAQDNAPHEANFLKLDCSALKAVFGWRPRWHMDTCMEMVCRFTRVWLDGGDIGQEMDREIAVFLSEEER